MKIRVNASTAAAVLINAKRAFIRENWLLQSPDGGAADFIRAKFRPYGQRLVNSAKVKSEDTEKAHELYKERGGTYARQWEGAAKGFGIERANIDSLFKDCMEQAKEIIRHENN